MAGGHRVLTDKTQRIRIPHMDSTELLNFRRDAQRLYTERKARLRRLYRLARELGFSSPEAKLLQGRSEDYIRELAASLRQR